MRRLRRVVVGVISLDSGRILTFLFLIVLLGYPDRKGYPECDSWALFWSSWSRLPSWHDGHSETRHPFSTWPMRVHQEFPHTSSSCISSSLSDLVLVYWVAVNVRIGNLEVPWPLRTSMRRPNRALPPRNDGKAGDGVHAVLALQLWALAARRMCLCF